MRAGVVLVPMNTTPNNLPASDIILVGTLRVIAYARDSKGHAHAMAYLEAECPADEKKSLMHTFQVLADLGEFKAPGKRFRHEKGGIFAAKGWQARVAMFRDGNVWFLTHGFTKKTDQWPPAELTRALRIMAEHLARTRKTKK